MSLTWEGAGRKFSARALFVVLASAGPHRDDGAHVLLAARAAIRGSDRAALADLLSDDVAFHSPVTDYRVLDQVVHCSPRSAR